jgi:hypothetical protein
MAVVKEAGPEDIENILQWSENHIQYEDCFGYPETRILKAEKDGNPVMYGIIYPGIIIEGFGMKPGITARDWIDGVGSLLDAYKEIATRRGVTDLVFFCGANANHLERWAQKHGFYLEKSHVYRLLLATEANNVREQVSGTVSPECNPAANGSGEPAGEQSQLAG